MKEFKNLETGNSKCLYRNKLDKACFPHDTAYSDSKAKRTILVKIYKDRAYKISRNDIYDGYQRALSSKCKCKWKTN